MPHHAAGAPGAIHIVLQGKGGIGKSFAALHLAQYFGDCGVPTAVFDSNPLTPGLANYQALRGRHISCMLDDDGDATQFDALANEILDASKHLVVLDTGTANFFAMLGYLKSKGVLQTFSELGRHVVIHSVLVGSAAARETLGGLVSTVENLAADGYVAWLNSHLGAATFDGKPFEETKAFKRIKERLVGIVRIRQRAGTSQILHLKAVGEMMRRHLTYKEAFATPEMWLWDRQRLAEARREVNSQLRVIFGSGEPIAAPLDQS
jgi:hypothetical protein